MGGEMHSCFNQFCKVCDKVTEWESASYNDETDTFCTEHEEDDQNRYDAREEILKLQSLNVEKSIQNLLHENHTESNCQCSSESGTATMRSEGAGDMEICLDCFGAVGCVY